MHVLNSESTHDRSRWTPPANSNAIHEISLPARGEAPSIETVMAFLSDAERGKASQKPLNAGVRLDTREADGAYYFETARAGEWVHRNYLAK